MIDYERFPLLQLAPEDMRVVFAALINEATRARSAADEDGCSEHRRQHMRAKAERLERIAGFFAPESKEPAS